VHKPANDGDLSANFSLDPLLFAGLWALLLPLPVAAWLSRLRGIIPSVWDVLIASSSSGTDASEEAAPPMPKDCRLPAIFRASSMSDWRCCKSDLD
jgi:hypothetical protein